MNVLGIGWVGLVSEKPETRKFYEEVLGLRLLEEGPAYAYFGIDDTAHLEILAPDAPLAARQAQGSPALGLLVEDLESALQELNRAEVKLLSEIETWESDEERHRWVYLEDPEGHVLLLLERQRTR